MLDKSIYSENPPVGVVIPVRRIDAKMKDENKRL